MMGWNSFLLILLQTIERTLCFRLSKINNHWEIMSRWLFSTHALIRLPWAAMWITDCSREGVAKVAIRRPVLSQ